MAFRKLCRFLALPLALCLGLANVALADPCDPCCQRTHCPPPLHHCMERPPCIKFKCGCPRPVCCPCNNPNWGYYQPCWVPWPWPPDWSHCPVAPPASLVIPGPANVLHDAPVTPAPPRFDLRPGL
jgi:hypothetical protein